MNECSEYVYDQEGTDADNEPLLSNTPPHLVSSSTCMLLCPEQMYTSPKRTLRSVIVVPPLVALMLYVSVTEPTVAGSVTIQVD